MIVSRNRSISGAARLVLLVLIAVPAAGSGPSDEVGTRIERVLAATPLIDGHNDLPWALRERFKGDLTKVDLNVDTSSLPLIGQPDRAAVALADWQKAHPKPQVTVAEVADHIEHIRKGAGVDQVGMGSDFDGAPDFPNGLDGVDKFPALLAELARRGWSDKDLAKVAGENVLRVLAQAEVVSARLRASRQPSGATIERLDAAAPTRQ